MLSDLRFAFRQLIKSPGFTSMAVLTLALGVGASTALFSVLHALVLDPFPYPHPEQIVYVRSNTGQPLSYPDFKNIQEQNRSFAEFGVYRPSRVNFGAEKVESLASIQCTEGVLHALDMKPALGRWLVESDLLPKAAPVAVISHALWLRSFQGEPNIIGRVIRLDGRSTEVVGVMPARFEFSSPWFHGKDFAVWSPLQVDDEARQSRGTHWLLGLARLKPGIPVSAANSEIKAIGTQLAREYPDTNTHKPFLVRSLAEEISRDTHSSMRPLGIAVALLLLVACTNIAGLLLARGTHREAEFRVRMALGASRSVLVRQLLTEALLLGALGSAAGVLLASWGVVALRQLIPATLIIEARRAAIGINGWVLLFAVAVALIAAVAAALVPALMVAHTSPAASQTSGSRSQAGSRQRSRYLRYLVGAQTAVTVVLVYAAILFTTSYLNVFKSNQALNTNRVLAAEIAPQGERYADIGSRVRFWNTLMDRVRALPGVEQAGLTTKLPLEGGNNFNVLIDDQKFDPTIRRPLVEESGVSPDYFAAMGVGWLRGSKADFVSAQGTIFPVAINEEMARTCWLDADPIGRTIRLNSTQSPYSFRVVAVVENVRQWGAESKPRCELYYVCTSPSAPAEALPAGRGHLIVRVAGDAHGIIPALRQELTQTDSDLPLSRIRTMDEVLLSVEARRRLSTVLVNVFTALALFLATVGIYATFSYIVSERTREIGVRIAIGAQRWQIFGMILKQAGWWVLSGLAPGILASIACSFVLRALLYGTSPFNPLVFLAGAGVVACVAIAASLAPTIRATRVEPTEALRAE